MASQTLGAGHDHATIWRNINTSDCLVVTFELIFQSEPVAGLAVQFNCVVFGYCQCLPIGGEGVIGNRVVEKVMNFRGCHVERIAIGDSLLLLWEVLLNTKL